MQTVGMFMPRGFYIFWCCFLLAVFLQINFFIYIFMVFECRRLQYSWLEGQSTLRSEDQAAALLLEVEVCAYISPPLFI